MLRLNRRAVPTTHCNLNAAARTRGMHGRTAGSTAIGRTAEQQYMPPPPANNTRPPRHGSTEERLRKLDKMARARECHFSIQ
eukprot:682942-Prymnesium_polylepis.1